MTRVPYLVTAPTGDVVTLADMKDHLNIEAAVLDDDAKVTGFIAAAISHLEGPTGFLGRFLLEQVWAIQLDSFCDPILRLPFVDVSAVEVQYRDDQEQVQTLAAANYTLTNDPKGSILVLHDDFDAPVLSEMPNPITVQMTVGYGLADDVPHALKLAIKMMVTQWYDAPHGLAEMTSEVPVGALALARNFRGARL